MDRVVQCSQVSKQQLNPSQRHSQVRNDESFGFEAADMAVEALFKVHIIIGHDKEKTTFSRVPKDQTEPCS